jgi:Protein of unknown function (DUF2785)
VSDTTPMLDLSGLGVRDAEAREAALAAFGDALLGAVRAADGAVRSTADALVSLLGAAESTARSAACQALGVVLIRDSERPCLGDGGFRRIRDALIGLVASGEEVDASCLADALDEVARHREATPADRVAVVQALATTVARTTAPFETEHDERIAYALVGVVSAGDVAPSEAADRFVMAQPLDGSARLNAKHVLRATAARTGEQAFSDAADQLVAH